MFIRFTAKLLVVFLYSFSLAYPTEGYLVHRDQFLLKEDIEQKKRDFYQTLHLSNETLSRNIREYKDGNPQETRNILSGSLYVFYDEDYNNLEKKEVSRIFLSGWLPTNVGNLNHHFGKEAFCLGNAYEPFSYFANASKILSIKKTAGLHSLSQSIKKSKDFYPNPDNPLIRPREEEVPFSSTFIHKLIEDFGTRDIDFESGANTYQHQNHAHTEQAFFSYIEHSLKPEETFAKDDLPKSVLVNMVSYLPICSGGFCLTAIKTLLSNEQFKYKFLKKIIPHAYTKHEADWGEQIKNININLLYTSADLPPIPELSFIPQNGMLYKTCN